MKKLLLILVLALAFSASDALAQCGGKVVNIKLPSEWGANTYVYLVGIFTKITGTKEGDWTKFTLPTLTDDNATATIIIADYNWHYNENGTTHFITKNLFSSDKLLPSEGNYFKCQDFGPDGTWIMEDPTRPGRTVFSTSPPNAYYLYFLPPRTRSWLEGTAYIMDKSGASRRMELDPDRCGWLKATYFNEEPPAAMMIGLGSTLQEPVGPINLAGKFDSLGSYNAFYTAGGNKWYAIDPIIEEPERCNYSIAAIIYDTDGRVNLSFDSVQTNYRTTEGGNMATCGADGCHGSGIARGLVKQDLVLDPNSGNMKMQFNSREPKWNTGWTEQNFIDAFKPTLGKNVVRCYDMPFKRNREGHWEFNSNKLCSDGSLDLYGTCRVGNTNNSYMWGFFPPELQTEGNADYSKCSSCNTKRKAESWVPINTNSAEISQYCYDRGRRGYGTCGTEFVEGDFRNGDVPNLGTSANAISVWSWNSFPVPPFPSSTNRPNLPDKNELFCFESAPSEFIYTKGQEFFFSGDDDIWVFINNKLVIDLGGTHLAAPGYVNLDNLELAEGEKYSMNIFFCDRRTTMSNVRISTDMYLAQTIASGEGIGLFLQTNGEICLKQNMNSCAALAETVKKEVICGAELASRISYKIVVRGLGEIPLDANNVDCEWISETQGLCYNGVLINNGKVSVDESAFSEEFLKTIGYEIHAFVSGYSPLNLSSEYPPASSSSSSSSIIKEKPSSSSSDSEEGNPSSSSGEDISIVAKTWQAMLKAKEPVYYNLKGKPLGNKKPSAAGAYILRQNGKSKLIVVR